MLKSISGMVVKAQDGEVHLMTMGCVIRLLCDLETVQECVGAVRQSVMLEAFLRIPEDGEPELYGFSSAGAGRAVFKALTGLPGIGYKSAWKILAAVGVTAVVTSAYSGKQIKAKGVGGKQASAIAGGELKRKLRVVGVEEQGDAAGVENDLESLASAMGGLGFKRAEYEGLLGKAGADLRAGVSVEAVLQGMITNIRGRG